MEKYAISVNDTLIGAIVYGEYVKIAFRFGDVTDKQTTLQKISGIQQDSRGSNVLQAIEIARDELFDYEKGSGRDAIKSAVVFIDAGQEIDPKLAEVSKQLKERGVKVISVEIGSFVGKRTPAKDALIASNLGGVDEVVDKITNLIEPGMHIMLFTLLFTGVMATGRASALQPVSCGFEPLPSHTKDFKNSTHCLLVWRST